MKYVNTIIVPLLFVFVLSACASRTVVRHPKKNKVTVVKVAPRGHKVVYVKGARYYKWNGKHYRKTRNGYVLVRL